MQKISIKDYVRLGIKDTENVCDIKEGDLIKVSHKSPLGARLSKETVGIVTQIFDESMCLIVGSKGHQWWSRYVKYEILSYNK